MMTAATAAAQQPIAGDNPGKAERRIDRILFGAEDEIEGVRIGWYIRDTFKAFNLAIDRQVPLVLVLHDGSCEYCWRMIDAFTCRSVNRFAGSAVFAIGDPDHEKMDSAIKRSLDISFYPSIPILEPLATTLVEAARISGYFPGDKIAEHLTAIMADYAKKPPEDQGGSRLRRVGSWVLRSEGSRARSVITPMSRIPDHRVNCAE